MDLSSRCSQVISDERASCSSSSNKEGTTLIVISYLDTSLKYNGCTYGTEEDKISYVSIIEFLD